MAIWQWQLRNVGTDPAWQKFPSLAAGPKTSLQQQPTTSPRGGGSLEWEQKVKMGCKMAAIQRQLVLSEKQGTF